MVFIANICMINDDFHTTLHNLLFDRHPLTSFRKGTPHDTLYITLLTNGLSLVKKSSMPLCCELWIVTKTKTTLC